MMRRAFTLLEVMVALTVLLIGCGFGGWRMWQAVQKKRFESDVQRLQARVVACQRLAVAAQTDWEGSLYREGKGWVFEAACLDGAEKGKMPPLHLRDLSLRFKGKTEDRIALHFFSSGEVHSPETWMLTSADGALRKEWQLSALLQRE